MNKKCLIRFEHDEFEDLMHYIEDDGAWVVLSREDSEKVRYVKKHGFLFVSKDIHSTKFKKMPVKVINDKETVEHIYIQMIASDNAYFTNGTDGLCVLKLLKD